MQKRLFVPRAWRGRRPACTGFTMVELLVVIAIIVVLAALGFVGMQRVMLAARQAKAIGPLREVASANMGYSAENSGHINVMRWGGDREEGKPYVGNSFWGRMEPHLFSDMQGGNQKKLQTQIKDRLGAMFSTKNPDKMTGTLISGSKVYHDTSGLPIPFAFNRNLYKWNNWVTVTEVGDVSGILYITYGFGFFDESDGAEYVQRPQDGSRPDNNIYYLPNRKAMVTFLDGHMEYLSPPIPERMLQQPLLGSAN